MAAYLKHYQVVVMTLNLKEVSQSHDTRLKIRIIYYKRLKLNKQNQLYKHPNCLSEHMSLQKAATF